MIAIIFTAIAYGRVTQEADKSRRNKGLITAILAGIIMDGFSASWRTPCLTISASLPAV